MYYFNEGDSGVALKDVLIFFSGASEIPPLGFDMPPSLSFDERIY